VGNGSLALSGMTVGLGRGSGTFAGAAGTAEAWSESAIDTPPTLTGAPSCQVAINGTIGNRESRESKSLISVREFGQYPLPVLN
jgi:hypothetical protein